MILMKNRVSRTTCRGFCFLRKRFVLEYIKIRSLQNRRVFFLLLFFLGGGSVFRRRRAIAKREAGEECRTGVTGQHAPTRPQSHSDGSFTA